MTEADIFNDRFDFDLKFKSGIYQCSYCGRITPNPYICISCGKQANQLFSSKTYKFIIKNESEEIQQIFKPIELESEEIQNDKE